jgi:membrane associated rhomboid family serine protease
VEGALGRARYSILLGLSWLLALTLQLLAGARTGAATIACAGAVAAVLGAYLALHPSARVQTVLFAPLFSTVLAVPAAILIGLWLALQVPIGLGLDEPLASVGGAWFAHLAALAVGVMFASTLARRPLAPPPLAR